MAGVGFALRRLTRGNDLGGIAVGFCSAVFITSGPWLLTVTSLGIITWLIANPGSLAGLESFRTILIYNFAFSLTFASPIVFLTTRLLADRIYVKNVKEVPGLLVTSLALAFGSGGVICGAFYAFVPDMSPQLRVFSIANYLAVTALWQVTAFLSALKDFRTIIVSFAIGLVLALSAATSFGSQGGTIGLLGGFTAGISVTVFLIIARIFAEYPYQATIPRTLLANVKVYWELPVAGFLYNAAIWVDKWVMWFAPDRLMTSMGLPTYPLYDVAMFLASLAIIPALALFMVVTETSFLESYLAYYRRIRNHGNHAQIVDSHIRLVGTLENAFAKVVLLQGSITCVIILSAPALFQTLNIAFSHLGVFRLAVLGILFHAILIYTIIVLSYLDLRRDLVRLTVLFFGSNAAFSTATLMLGYVYYGYGYFLACLVSALAGLHIAWRRLSQLPYLTFVACNPSVMGRSAPKIV